MKVTETLALIECDEYLDFGDGKQDAGFKSKQNQQTWRASPHSMKLQSIWNSLYMTWDINLTWI